MRRARLRAVVLAVACVMPVSALFLASPATAVSLPMVGACQSSIDPSCEPANWPLLVELFAEPASGGAPAAAAAVEAGAVQTGSVATAAVATGAATGVGTSLGAEALGGTAGLILAGSGLLPWVAHLFADDGSLPPPKASGPQALGTSCVGTSLTGCAVTPVAASVAGTTITYSYRLSAAADWPSNFNSGVAWGEEGICKAASGATYLIGPGNTYFPSLNNQYAYYRGAYSTPGTLVTSSRSCFPVQGVPYYPSQFRMWGTVPGAVIMWPQQPVTGGTRTIEQTVTCKKNTGETYTISNTSAAITWTPGQSVAIAGLMCPSGERATQGSASVVGDPGTGKEVGSVSAPAGAASAVPNACYGSGVVCILDYQKSVGGSWQSCFAGADCVGSWQLAPQVQAQNYRCVYGDGAAVPWAAVSMTQCSAYRGIFSRPVTPRLVPPEPPPSADDPCSIGWGEVLNGSVMYLSVACALKWAFVPRAEVVGQHFATVQGSWSGTAFGQVGGVVAGLGGAFNPGAVQGMGCAGPSVSFGFITDAWDYDIHPLDSCSGLPHTIHEWASPVILVMFWLSALMSVYFILGDAFGLRHD